MAKQVKKSNTKTSTKKKVTSKKTTKKRKPTKAQKKRRQKRNMIIVIALLIMFSLIGFGYYLGKGGLNDDLPQKKVEEGYTTKKLLDDLAKIKVKIPDTPTVVKPEPKKVENKKIQKQVVKKQKTKQIKMAKKQESRKKIVVTPLVKRAKLVIIIDDVSKRSHIEAIKATHMKITPSIFPPYRLAKHSNMLAKGLTHYMIHLPMESGNQQFNTQSKTLLTHFSRTQMKERAKELRILFPRAKYINNHTGSVFTANYTAMYRLYSVLREEGFLFLDSRTIGNSKVRKISREFGDKYISRDIFIDNIHEVGYIHKQLKKAVKIAQKKGYAVAIGHPHKVTIEAIASAKDILKDVELVYIDELYKRK